MCGIFGIWSRRGAPPAADAVVRAVTAMRHRGPDDEGYVWIESGSGRAAAFGGGDTPADLFDHGLAHVRDAARVEGDLVLANRRLAILDLSSAGHQPMSDSSRRNWLTYNGEIYNFAEVRDSLERLGHRFRSQADTEVLLHAYAEWGVDCLPRLNGMFAFAIWDPQRRSLLLARDRFGVKPLYYAWDGRRLAFASEIKALLGIVGAERNLSVIDAYLAHGYVDEGDETFFRGIEQLPPGHFLQLTGSDAGPRIHEWYRLPAPLPREKDAQIVGRLRAVFQDAVHLRLVSDVPVGTCLSGGIDSSAIACMVDQLLSRGDRAGSADRQLAFSAQYDDPRHDEGRYIDAVSAATAIEAHSIFPTGDTLRDDLLALVWHQEEPFASTSIYAQWSVFRLAREAGAVVTLDGQGGDEVLGGYLHYFGPYLAGLLRAGHVTAFISEAAAMRRNHGFNPGPLAARTGAALLPWGIRRRLSSHLRRPVWVLPSSGSAPPSRSRVLEQMPADPLAAQVYRDITVGLRNLLRVCDRNSMAHSVESRLPFLDYRLVELGYSAPARAKIQNGTTKVAFRQALAGTLPEVIRTRQSKIGFSTPEDDWFRSQLRPTIEGVLCSESFRSRPYFDFAAVEETFADHLAGRADHSRAIWRWLNLEMWERLFLD